VREEVCAEEVKVYQEGRAEKRHSPTKMDENDDKSIRIVPMQETSSTTTAQADEAPPAVSYIIPTDPSSTTSVSSTIHLYGKNFQQVESESHDENHTGRTPTGLALWPAGKLVADFLACSSSTESNGSGSTGTPVGLATNPRTVIELGCGLGLCGLVSRAIHQQQQQAAKDDTLESEHHQQLVVLTDSDQETLDHARRNVEQNQQCPDTQVCLEILDWCSPQDIQRVKNLTSIVDVGGDGGYGYDRVLASDVIYEATAPILKDFLHTAKSLLRKPAGLFVLGIRRRTTSLQEVRAMAAAAGLEGGGFVSEFLLDLFDNRLEGDENLVAQPEPDNNAGGADDDSKDCHDPNDEPVDGDDSDSDDGGSSLFWAQAVLVFWHAGDEVGKELASTVCEQATTNAANGWLD
jgi:predicted nicotinamide N-methyase